MSSDKKLIYAAITVLCLAVAWQALKLAGALLFGLILVGSFLLVAVLVVASVLGLITLLFPETFTKLKLWYKNL